MELGGLLCEYYKYALKMHPDWNYAFHFLDQYKNVYPSTFACSLSKQKPIETFLQLYMWMYVPASY